MILQHPKMHFDGKKKTKQAKNNYTNKQEHQGSGSFCSNCKQLVMTNATT